VFASLVRDKHCFVLSLHPLQLQCLTFCNYSVLSVSIIHLLKSGTRVRLIRRGEAFKETNCTHVFLFLMMFM
jgi:hypothetical protein